MEAVAGTVTGEAPGAHAARGGVEARRAERFAVSGVRCGLGVVTDVSALGMRIEAPLPWPVGRARLVAIRAGESTKKVKARCVWRRRERVFRWVCGVSFDDLNQWRLKEAVELMMSARSEQAGPARAEPAPP